MRENLEDGTVLQIGVVHGNVGSCGSGRYPGIYARLEDPEIFDFISRAMSG